MSPVEEIRERVLAEFKRQLLRNIPDLTPYEIQKLAVDAQEDIDDWAAFVQTELRRLGASAVDVPQCQCGDGGCIECWPTNFTKETLIKHFRERLRIVNAWASRNADLESENNMLCTALDVDGLAREIDDYYMGLPSDHETLNDMHQSAVVAHIAAIIRKHIAQPAAPQWVKASERLPEDDSDVFAAVWWVNKDNPAYSRYAIHDCAYYEGGLGSRQKIFSDCEGDEFEVEDVAYWIYKKDLAASFPAPSEAGKQEERRDG